MIQLVVKKEVAGRWRDLEIGNIVGDIIILDGIEYKVVSVVGSRIMLEENSDE